jgi:hypothetical protein
VVSRYSINRASSLIPSVLSIIITYDGTTVSPSSFTSLKMATGFFSFQFSRHIVPFVLLCFDTNSSKSPTCHEELRAANLTIRHFYKKFGYVLVVGLEAFSLLLLSSEDLVQKEKPIVKCWTETTWSASGCERRI